MSIEKEVEKMYREDAEKQKKNQKKKKSGRAATIIVLILIVILALLLAKLLGLFDGSGFGFGGKGKETEDGSGTPDRAVVVSAEEDESSEAEVKKVYDNIKVSGSTYLYKGSEVVALIEDDNATQNTMEDLTNALTEMGREYTIENATGTESETESAAQ